ncbi:hypothetical protein [Amycolatopsis sp. H20-H5]|uniref:hypothetical protein n=1 Tax=Amycolatopsis sp. H20-H5 TaxID=3046309 RepID=UPI002DBB1894|nr:hypothetical protein [Amycolatopsis sp. H20-H5]MEC3981911.1 hypothetical protein [Amycolatopsis sp. H20-H5]
MVVVFATLGLQLILPVELVLKPWWLLPALSGLLVVALLLINPGRMDERSRVERMISLVLVAVVSIANGVSAGQLVAGIATGTLGDQAARVLVSGGIVYWTNIVVFSLWYWEFDRGGPGMRAVGRAEYADLMFPQMSDPELAHKDWEPSYLDYLYLSFTNATAFSPTDVMPLRLWAKMTMMLQAAISLVLALMVLAWAVSGLKS